MPIERAEYYTISRAGWVGVLIEEGAIDPVVQCYMPCNDWKICVDKGPFHLLDFHEQQELVSIRMFICFVRLNLIDLTVKGS